MSRVGKAEIKIPSAVKLTVAGKKISVEGPKGKLEHQVHERISVENEAGTIRFKRSSDMNLDKALHGTTRAVVNNMIVGVTDGFTKDLEIQGVGYRGEQKGKALNLLLGFSHPVLVDPPEGITLKMNGNDKIQVSGIDKQKVGQVASEIRAFRPPEPYKGKGVRYAGEHIVKKEVKKT